MNVWIVFVGETFAADGSDRVWRYGYLGDALLAAGHQVVRWAPSFCHALKRQRAEADVLRSERRPGMDIRLVPAPSYRLHVGPGRLRSYRVFTRRLASLMEATEPPDLIVAGLPTPETCAAVASYSARHGLPFVIDVRDLWPDVFIDLAPHVLRRLWRRALDPLFRRCSATLARASAVTAISSTYLDWASGLAGRPQGELDAIFPIGYRRPRVSDAACREAERRWLRLGADPDSFICCFFGSMNRQFDLTTVVEAARRLQHDSRGSCQFILCGHGPSRRRLLGRARGLRNVILPGWVDAADIQVLMGWASVGLAPYASGASMSLPNKAAEYLSAGLPILGSLDGELRRLLESNACGWYYRAESADDLADRVRVISSTDGDLPSMGRAARVVFERLFDADKIYPAMVQHLENVWRLGSTAPGGRVRDFTDG